MTKEAILLLSGGFKYDTGKKVWRSTGFNEVSDCGPIGSIVRVMAAAYLYAEDSNRIIVASGGRGECNAALPPGEHLSSILKRELIELEVPPGNIIEDYASHSTYQQLLHMVDTVKWHACNTVVIVSNAFHLPRIETMLQYRSEIASLAKVARTISAEEVVLAHELEWKSVIDEAYAQEPLLTTIKKEKQGVADIRNNRYSFK